MTDLKVDYAVLEDSVSTLGSLRTAFDEIKTRGDDTEDLWGHHEIRDAMDEFSSNMDHHREELSNEIGDVGEKLEMTLQTFRDADQKLKDDLEKSTSEEHS